MKSPAALHPCPPILYTGVRLAGVGRRYIIIFFLTLLTINKRSIILFMNQKVTFENSSVSARDWMYDENYLVRLSFQE